MCLWHILPVYYIWDFTAGTGVCKAWTRITPHVILWYVITCPWPVAYCWFTTPRILVGWRQPHFNTLRPRQNGHHFADDNFKRIFLNENVRISIEISLKFFPKGRINNIPSLVQMMAWCRPGDKPLSEPMKVRSPTHIYVARPQWVNSMWPCDNMRCHLEHVWMALRYANELICRITLINVSGHPRLQ